MDLTAIRIKEKDARIFSHIFWNKIPPESQALLTDRKQEKALLQSIIGQALLAYLLKKKEGIDYSRCRIVYGAFGKPMIAEQEIHYNISHSGVWVVCALGHENVGIDIELVHPLKKNSANLFLSLQEKAALHDVKEAENAIYRLWVLKESYCKYTGKGLHLPMNRLTFYRDQNGFLKINADKDVSFQEYSIEKGYYMAICSKGYLPDLVSIVDIPELIRVLDLEIPRSYHDID